MSVNISKCWLLISELTRVAGSWVAQSSPSVGPSLSVMALEYVPLWMPLAVLGDLGSKWGLTKLLVSLMKKLTVHPKGDQSWIFIGRTDAEAETPILWPPGAKSWLIWKDPDAGKDWGQEEKGTTEDEMVGWTRWTWVWVDSGSWWWTGKPGVLWFMGSQRGGHSWATELNWTDTLKDQVSCSRSSSYQRQANLNLNSPL